MAPSHFERVWWHASLVDQDLLVVTGPSGGGKTTLARALSRRLPKSRLVVKHTDRAPRMNERDGIDYCFVSSDWFGDAISRGRLLAYARRYGHKYAVLANHVLEIAEAEQLPTVILDPHLALLFRSFYPRSVCIFVGPRTVGDIVGEIGRRPSDYVNVDARQRLAVEELAVRDEFDLDFVIPCPTDSMVRTVSDHPIIAAAKTQLI